MFGLVLAGPAAPTVGVAAADVPARLTDQEFWKLTTDLSEPDGSFRSENLLSNEMVLAQLMPQVVAKAKPGGVYIGVGPEQNFSYFAVTNPRIAFIMDIRRGNLHVLMMYKALFELSADRVEFVGKLFTKARPAGLSASSTVTQIMDAYWNTPSGDEAAYNANLQAILTKLTKGHGFPLGQQDIDGISRSYRAFYWYGPTMTYAATTSLTGGGGGGGATYHQLMTQMADDGQPLSYLGTEAKFRVIKDMNSRNVIVPLVGNFGGPKTIRAIGEWARSQSATVSTFYVSTVEHYLRSDGLISTFCASVDSLPITDASVFIRPGNAQQILQTPGGSAAIAAVNGTTRPAVGSYQIGVVVPIKGGCG